MQNPCKSFSQAYNDTVSHDSLSFGGQQSRWEGVACQRKPFFICR